VSEFTFVYVVKVLAFERLHYSFSPVGGLGGVALGLPSVSEAAADAALRGSDFAVLGVDRDPHETDVYPVNNSLRQLAPHLYETATREMARVRDVSFFGRHLTLFMKPSVHCSGDSGGWIASTGMTCEAPGAVLAVRGMLRLQGRGNFAWLGATPAVTARIVQGDHDMGSVPCQVATRAPDTPAPTRPYTISCDLRAASLASSELVSVTLSFDRYFVPKQIGLNDDLRRLVLAWPTAIDAQP
jgi:hypothetical protein